MDDDLVFCEFCEGLTPRDNPRCCKAARAVYDLKAQVAVLAKGARAVGEVRGYVGSIARDALKKAAAIAPLPTAGEQAPHAWLKPPCP